jgi:hypothetical protein
MLDINNVESEGNEEERRDCGWPRKMELVTHSFVNYKIVNFLEEKNSVVAHPCAKC